VKKEAEAAQVRAKLKAENLRKMKSDAKARVAQERQVDHERRRVESGSREGFVIESDQQQEEGQEQQQAEKQEEKGEREKEKAEKLKEDSRAAGEGKASVLAMMSPTEREAALAMMSPTEREAALAMMSPTEREAALAMMSPTEREAALAALERNAKFADMPPEELEKALLVADMPPEELEKALLVAALSPEEKERIQTGLKAVKKLKEQKEAADEESLENQRQKVLEKESVLKARQEESERHKKYEDAMRKGRMYQAKKAKEVERLIIEQEDAAILESEVERILEAEEEKKKKAAAIVLKLEIERIEKLEAQRRMEEEQREAFEEEQKLEIKKKARIAKKEVDSASKYEKKLSEDAAERARNLKVEKKKEMVKKKALADKKELEKQWLKDKKEEAEKKAEQEKMALERAVHDQQNRTSNIKLKQNAMQTGAPPVRADVTMHQVSHNSEQKSHNFHPDHRISVSLESKLAALTHEAIAHSADQRTLTAYEEAKLKVRKEAARRKWAFQEAKRERAEEYAALRELKCQRLADVLDAEDISSRLELLRNMSKGDRNEILQLMSSIDRFETLSAMSDEDKASVEETASSIAVVRSLPLRDRGDYLMKLDVEEREVVVQGLSVDDYRSTMEGISPRERQDIRGNLERQEAVRDDRDTHEQNVNETHFTRRLIQAMNLKRGQTAMCARVQNAPVDEAAPVEEAEEAEMFAVDTRSQEDRGKDEAEYASEVVSAVAVTLKTEAMAAVQAVEALKEVEVAVANTETEAAMEMAAVEEAIAKASEDEEDKTTSDKASEDEEDKTTSDKASEDEEDKTTSDKAAEEAIAESTAATPEAELTAAKEMCEAVVAQVALTASEAEVPKVTGDEVTVVVVVVEEETLAKEDLETEEAEEAKVAEVAKVAKEATTEEAHAVGEEALAQEIATAVEAAVEDSKATPVEETAPVKVPSVDPQLDEENTILTEKNPYDWLQDIEGEPKRKESTKISVLLKLRNIEEKGTANESLTLLRRILENEDAALDIIKSQELVWCEACGGKKVKLELSKTNRAVCSGCGIDWAIRHWSGSPTNSSEPEIDTERGIHQDEKKRGGEVITPPQRIAPIYTPATPRDGKLRYVVLEMESPAQDPVQHPIEEQEAETSCLKQEENRKNNVEEALQVPQNETPKCSEQIVLASIRQLVTEVESKTQIICAQQPCVCEAEVLHMEAVVKALNATPEVNRLAVRLLLDRITVASTTKHFHPHPLKMVMKTEEPWGCDGCQGVFAGKTPRYRCMGVVIAHRPHRGCDYDMCRECYTLAYMSVFNRLAHQAKDRVARDSTIEIDDVIKTDEFDPLNVADIKPQSLQRAPSRNRAKRAPPGCVGLWNGVAPVLK